MVDHAVGPQCPDCEVILGSSEKDGFFCPECGMDWCSDLGMDYELPLIDRYDENIRYDGSEGDKREQQ